MRRNNISVANEISRLHALMKDDVISQEEFDLQKKRLLGTDKEIIGDVRVEAQQGALSSIGHAFVGLFKLVALIALVLFFVKTFFGSSGEVDHVEQKDAASQPVEAAQLEPAMTIKEAASDSLASRALVEKSIRNVRESLKDPDKRRMMECIGVQVYQTPPDGWTPPTEEECQSLKERLQINDGGAQPSGSN